MTKEAKIKKFKFAFDKPDAPSKELRDKKTRMEKLMKTGASKKMTSKSEGAKDEIETLLKEITKTDEDYGKKLLNYKLTKHWGDPLEFGVWAAKAPEQQQVVDFINEVMGDNPTDKQLSDCFFHAPRIDAITKKCWAQAPDQIVKDGLAYVEKHKSAPPGDLAPYQSKVALALAKKGKMKDIPPGMDYYFQPEDIREIALTNPVQFAKQFVEKATPSTKLRLIQDPDVRDALAKDPTIWNKLKEDAPVLAMLEKVKLKVAGKEDLTEEEVAPATAKAVFKELLSDDGALGLTYYTNKFTSPSDVMCSSKENLKAIIKQNRSGGDTDTMPDQPAMQCDELVTVLKSTMEAALGPNSELKCNHIVIKSIVLTQPMNTLPGGLLKNTFGGNVYNDANSLTKGVLFTGNDFGATPDAHTYLDVGGMLYDAVLGTSGTGVTDAVADEFNNWVKDQWVTKDEAKTPVWVASSKKGTGNFVIKQAGLKAAANSNGFSTAYRLTDDVSKYLDPA